MSPEMKGIYFYPPEKQEEKKQEQNMQINWNESKIINVWFT